MALQSFRCNLYRFLADHQHIFFLDQNRSTFVVSVRDFT